MSITTVPPRPQPNICRPLDSTVSEDGGIELGTVVTLALTIIHLFRHLLDDAGRRNSLVCGQDGTSGWSSYLFLHQVWARRS